MELFVTPYRICTCVFVRVFCMNPSNFKKTDHWLFLKDLIEQDEYPAQQLIEMIEAKCGGATLHQFELNLGDLVADMNNLFDHVKSMRECPHVDSTSFAGLYLRKITIYFDRLTHQACSRLFDDLRKYYSEMHTTTITTTTTHRRSRNVSANSWQTPRKTRSSLGTPRADVSLFMKTPTTAAPSTTSSTTLRPIYQINHEISRLQSNELRAMNPKDLYESLKRPSNTCKRDAAFLRYLNLLRVNESVGSKHLLLAYFDMVSDSVSRSYSALNYAIWYMHHGEYKRAIECLQECYCCAQAADDDRCLLMALMWLARILIQAKQKNSTKYNVTALLELVRKRSHKSGMAYVQAMSSMTLEQLVGPVDNSEALKKSSETLKQVALSSKQQNLLLATSNQPNPLDKEDGPLSAEILAVRNSMNDVLAMYYALSSAHLSLVDANQSSALASQTLLHFDLIEKCGNEDLFLMNESIFIAVRNLAHHVWHSTRDIHLVREILVDLCSNKIPIHRSDNHSMWRQTYSEISFEFHIEQENWSEATQMISIIRETDQDGAQLREAELLQLIGLHDEALTEVDDLIKRIEYEENNLTDPVDSFHETTTSTLNETNATTPTKTANGSSKRGDHSQRRSAYPTNSKLNAPAHPTLSIEHKAFVKSKALLLRAILLDDETKILESLQYACDNRFMHIKTSCLLQLARRCVDKTDTLMDSIVVEVFANGTRLEKQKLRELLDTLK